MDTTFDLRACNYQTGWPIVSDGFFKNKMSEQLIKDGIPSGAIDQIFHNAASILSNCPNPFNETPDSKTGIVIGKVQSGKTSNFISLMALAFDNCYDIVVVLGGTKIPLLRQNITRINSYFDNIDQSRLVILATNQNESILNSSTIKQFIQERRKVVIVGLKGEVRINTITRIFSDAYLSTVPTLVIDDEGDQATLNTAAFRDSMSTTYEAAVTLKAHLQRHCFLSITATPQANILIKTCDQLSPDFGVLVYPGDDYCGLEEFHGEDQDTYIKVIPNNEPSILDDTGLPHSFYYALATFFVGRAIRIYRGDSAHHAMLIHPSQRKYDHGIVLHKVNSLLNDWRECARIKLDGINDTSYKHLKMCLVTAYENLISDGVIAPPFSEIELHTLSSICECPDAHLCNSDIDASENSKFFRVNIFVGGNMVERGLTIKGLAVTYIIRRARGVSNVDNTEQRARWFGYKRNFLDVCRVFTTQPIKDDFSAILEHDDDLWATIERTQLNGVPFKEIPRVFILANDLLRMTRRNVARADRFRFSEWSKQLRLLLNNEIVAENNRLLSIYRIENNDKIEMLEYHGVNQHAVLRDVNFFELKDRVLNNWTFPSGDTIDKTFFDKLEAALIKSNIIPIIDIFWMRDTTHETRTLFDVNKINQLFQGRNSNQNSPTYYPGDSSMVTNDRCDIMQLQIHYIKPKNLTEYGFYSPALALYVPATYSSQMSQLVGQL